MGRTEDETRVDGGSAEVYTGGGVLRSAAEQAPVKTSVRDKVVKLLGEETEETEETGGSTGSTLTT